MDRHFIDTQIQILQELRQGKSVGAHDKERSQRVYFDKEQQAFFYWIDEFGVGEHTELLNGETEALAAIKSIRSFAHPHDEEMWESILAFLKKQI